MKRQVYKIHNDIFYDVYSREWKSHTAKIYVDGQKWVIQKGRYIWYSSRIFYLNESFLGYCNIEIPKNNDHKNEVSKTINMLLATPSLLSQNALDKIRAIQSKYFSNSIDFITRD